MRNTSPVLLFAACLMGFCEQGSAADNNNGISLSSVSSVVQEVVQRESAGARVRRVDDGRVLAVSSSDEPAPGSDELPLQYLGPGLPDRWAPDGHLMYSPGVQNIQVSRANRKHPPSFIPSSQRHLGWTYQHHIGIGCWKGKYYAVWDMTPKDEDIPPCHVVYS
ncbi:MAG: hypothetical protein ACYS4W_06760, partial [Planctomycetota bacterium]